jgi:DHA1 family multidrug resistance protein-like MFS transporter
MAAPVFLLFFFFLPETQPTTILLHRSARLRALTGNPNIRTQTEIDRKGTKFTATLLEAIIKPIEICIKDPAILFINIYSALTYGIYYSFFEVFPLVYLEIYGFSVGEMTIVFLAIIVGCFIAVTIYFSYLRFYLIPDIVKRGLRPQEHRLVPAIFASFGVPIGLFIFGKFRRAASSEVEVSDTNGDVCRLDGSSLCTLDRFSNRYHDILDERLHYFPGGLLYVTHYFYCRL